MQARVYAAQLFIDHQELILSVLQSIGHNMEELKQLGDSTIRGLVQDIPTLNVEMQLAVKLEAQSKEIFRNDLMDMHSFSVAIPYADWVIAEKTFVSLANQAKLGSAYRTTIINDLGKLPALLESCA